MMIPSRPTSRKLPVDQIAAVVRDGISTDTLYKHFREIMIRGKVEKNAKVAQSLYQRALNGDTTAMIWWTKTQMGWKEASRVEVSGAEGVPSNLTVEFVTVKPKVSSSN